MGLHIAYDLTTGEVITSNHSRHLRRLVSISNRANIKHGFPTGCWVFAHGKHAWDTLRKKIV